jgi:AcrR family transcriptional regulator
VDTSGRTHLDRAQVLRAAVDLADAEGIEQVSMRHLAQRLGVVPMALYKHVANKEELLDGMVDVLVGQIPTGTEDQTGWRTAVRDRILAARRTMLAHPWASALIESRGAPTPTVLAYIDSLTGLFLDGGLSPELAHQAMHSLGSRMWGFTQEVFPSAPVDPAAVPPEQLAAFAAAFPHVLRIAVAARHTPEGIVGAGCDDQLEFEFALDLVLDGIARREQEGWPG